MKYIVNGVAFSKDEVWLLLTLQHLIMDTQQQEEEEMRVDCTPPRKCRQRHIRALQAAAAWLCREQPWKQPLPKDWQEQKKELLRLTQQLEEVLREVDLLQESGVLWVLLQACEFFNFEALLPYLRLLLVSKLPTDEVRLRHVFQREGEGSDFSEEELAAAQQEAADFFATLSPEQAAGQCEELALQRVAAFLSHHMGMLPC